jgi:type VI secretion system secreted protein VgrG
VQPPSVEKEYAEYGVEIVPKFWELTERMNCRIFQDKKADEIIKKVLDDAGMSGRYELKLTTAYPKREYCVQYRESDFDFLSRIMEGEGIFYFFTHDGGEDKLVLTDANSQVATCAPDAKVKYKVPTELMAAEEVVTDLEYHAELYGGKVKFKDFDYRKVEKPLLVEHSADSFTDLEDYDYHPERYTEDGRGKTLAKVRCEASAACHTMLSASGPWRSAAAGHKFTLEKAFRSDLNREWIILTARHDGSQLAGAGVDYETKIEAFPTDIVFRPEITTPSPEIGPQTATVVGPPGEDRPHPRLRRDALRGQRALYGGQTG